MIPRKGGRYLREMGPRFDRMADYFDRFENEFFGGMETMFPRLSREGLSISMDVHEESDRFIITADIPGMTKEDIKVQVTPDRLLTISGERQSETKDEQESFVRSERRFGKFYRSFHLPKNADEEKISATTEHGVLKVTIMKLEKGTDEARVIDIE